jgi:hypothetical protein
MGKNREIVEVLLHSEWSVYSVTIFPYGQVTFLLEDAISQSRDVPKV